MTCTFALNSGGMTLLVIVLGVLSVTKGRVAQTPIWWRLAFWLAELVARVLGSDGASDDILIVQSFLNLGDNVNLINTKVV